MRIAGIVGSRTDAPLDTRSGGRLRTRRGHDGAARAGRMVVSLLAVCLLVGPAVASSAGAAVSVKGDRAGQRAVAAAGDASIARRYTIEFYPLWFTYQQSFLATSNQLIGPDRISPVYQAVVAINDDTLYASTPIDVATEPVIVTVPPTDAGYSVLSLDPYGNVLPSPVPSKPSGTISPTTVYALVAPGYTGPLPAGATRMEMPLDFTFLLFRVDKFAPDGTDQTRQAAAFRAALKLQNLTDYNNDPAGGATDILPERTFAVPIKTVADTLIKSDPLRFLRRLQVAVHSSNTPALTPQQQRLSDAFDRRFGRGRDLDRAGRRAFGRGAQTAHAAILANYLRARGPNQWIHFTNIGEWGNRVLDRASITEFIQYGNDISTAAYYHTFRDRRSARLRGSARRGYVMRFPRGGQPPAERFWSLTAYTPNAIELIPNPARKYLVARYTPGLQTNSDGSLSIHISRTKPRGVPTANWLPVANRPFNLMLRVYGVESGSSVANNTYVPPPIVKR
jgi:hypothetical protein